MSVEQTISAKSLVAAVARAFVDFLLRERFLKDGRGMGKRLSLSTKQTRAILVFLQKESITAIENVTGIVETRSSTRTYRRPKTKQFWYIDLNRAVHSIRLRLHLMKSALEKAVIAASSKSTYMCPGYKTKACNGMYDELDVQSCAIDELSGMFLCQECHELYRHQPDQSPHSYVLELVDTKRDFVEAQESLRRLDTQLRAKSVQGQVMRVGIYDLIQGCTKGAGSGEFWQPVTSNLPSQNGAELCLDDDKDEAPLTFVGEAADEFAGLTCFWIDGERVALDIERKAGCQAVSWAVTGGPSNEGRLLSAVQKLASRPLSIPPAAALAPRPQKLACRHKTPEFLHDGKVRGIPDREECELSVLERRTSELTIDPMPEQHHKHVVASAQDTHGYAFYGSPLRKTLSWEKIFQSGSSYASVEWEEGCGLRDDPI